MYAETKRLEACILVVFLLVNYPTSQHHRVPLAVVVHLALGLLTKAEKEVVLILVSVELVA